MWYIGSSDQAEGNGTAYGSRAILATAIFFLMICVGQVVVSTYNGTAQMPLLTEPTEWTAGR